MTTTSSYRRVPIWLFSAVLGSTDFRHRLRQDSRLVTGDADRATPAYRPRTAVCLERAEDRTWQGQGVSQDYTEAAKWYRKAAEQGNGPAQASLGQMYFRGEGVPEDLAEAGKLLMKSIWSQAKEWWQQL